MCARLIASQSNVVDCHRYGTRGDFQAGIDILSHRRTDEGGRERWCYQCKRWKEMPPTSEGSVYKREATGALLQAISNILSNK